MKIEQLAINSVSTMKAPISESLPAYHAAGFANVELALGQVKAFLADGHTVADVQRLLADNGQRCIGGFEVATLCFGEGQARADNHRQLVANARLLAELGDGCCMVTGTDGPAGGAAVADPLAVIAETFAQVADRIAETGVTLCLEFNWSPIVKSFRTAAEVARRANRPNVGIMFDPAHYHCTPSKLDQLTAANVACVRHVHVNDMRDKPGELSNCNSDRVLPGAGCLDLRTLFGRLEQHGYAGYFSIEMFSEELWALPAAQAAAKMYASLLPLCR